MTVTTDIGFDVRVSNSPLTADERARILAAPGFGEVFTDHMITLRWTEGRGWHDGRLEPYGPFTLDPATAVLHYAQEIFEGLKAYRTGGGGIVAFRPHANAARFNRSAARMAMPELPEDTFVHALEILVTQDREWVPTAKEHSLYLRPFMIATQRGLGVNRPSATYQFTVIASPAAAYFASGVKPVSVWLSREFCRAAPGGTGEAKCGGNYAASFAGQQLAVANGCDQVVWLDEPVLRLRDGPAGEAGHPRANRQPPARDHPGHAAQARPRPRCSGRGGRDIRGPVAGAVRGR
jgi:branched-chain amino acid aminotransferase